MSSYAAVCPSLERLDLVQQLVKSYRNTWTTRKGTPVTAEGAEPVADPAPPLVVVAQGPDDGTAGWCQYQGIEVVRVAEPMPFAKAVNIGASQPSVAAAEWLLILNNDVILAPGSWDALEEMIAFHYDVVGAKLLYPDGKIQHVGKLLTLDLYPFHALRSSPGDHPRASQIWSCPTVTFACVAIRRTVWDDLTAERETQRQAIVKAMTEAKQPVPDALQQPCIGALDEDYSNGFEDDDLCLRSREHGGQVGVHPGFGGVHLESQTTGHDNANKEVQWGRFKAKWIDNQRIWWPAGLMPIWRDAG